ncbi:hypothetical protein [Paraburkholderia phenoliruptrix]|uniref:hypothetical protein n=1 Tax=Paraburkholderia phenoliruptrix TaxID=252970 RepID=UPI001C6DE70E|nr:hypothetical protein [Paraburkholderia phenoliruptrix]MBW9103006.1 hypothetical protein [Paraburkholderia phenoliruptrix]MBW9127811.1 hypothetical protein [Paraburkholderia ginsengiterrae]
MKGPIGKTHAAARRFFAGLAFGFEQSAAQGRPLIAALAAIVRQSWFASKEHVSQGLACAGGAAQVRGTFCRKRFER